MRTLTRRLARRSWLVLGATAVVAAALAVALVLIGGGGRYAVVATAFTGLVVVGVLAAFLDAILVPGNPEVRRRAGHAAGWSGALGPGWSDGGGSGDGGGSCG